MVSISNVDLVMAALRSRLRRVGGEKRAVKATPLSSARSEGSTGQEQIEGLRAMRRLPTEEFERTLIRTVLEMELGEVISQDPRFHRIVDRTHRMLREDPELRRAMRQIQLG